MKEYMISESPFKDDASFPNVYLAGGNGPYENTRAALKNIDLSCAAGKTVLLKPNVGRIAEPYSGICTHPMVVAAAIDAFREAGAEVSVGESPISGVKTMEAFESTGIKKIADERNCPLIDMDEGKPVVISVPEGEAIKSLKICPNIPEFDIIVSIPVMKMHMHTVVTLAVKNMKGCLWRRSKVTLHMLPPLTDEATGRPASVKPLDVAISDLSKVLKPHLSIIDGTVGLQGIGPSAGEKKEVGVVVVGVDSFAADAVACEIMGISASEVPHLSIGADRGYGVIDMEKINVFPADWKKWISPFERPPTNFSKAFPDVNIMDVNSCSACQSTLLLFLKRYQAELKEYLPGDTNIAIGAGHDDIPPGTLCVGNCIKKEFRTKGIFIAGCPPVGSEILSAVIGEPSVDTRDGHSAKADDLEDD
jgi:uncharacterized protein (DUF362 family)